LVASLESEVLIEAHELFLNDKILIIGSTTGVHEDTVTEIRVDDKTIEVCQKGIKCSIPISSTVRRSDKLYRVISAEELFSKHKNGSNRNN
jgi:putative protease